MEQVTLKVEGMSCSHCKAAVEKALKGVPGVQGADVDLAAKTVKVSYDGKKAGKNDLARAIAEAGYDVVG
ncbi:MAG: copper ion binding protein [Firmicutes bacterium]|nr:copper ion binding protein [Bacillota bacterium]